MVVMSTFENVIEKMQALNFNDQVRIAPTSARVPIEAANLISLFGGKFFLDQLRQQPLSTQMWLTLPTAYLVFQTHSVRVDELIANRLPEGVEYIDNMEGKLIFKKIEYLFMKAKLSMSSSHLVLAYTSALGSAMQFSHVQTVIAFGTIGALSRTVETVYPHVKRDYERNMRQILRDAQPRNARLEIKVA